MRSTEDDARRVPLLTELGTFTLGAPGAVLEATAPGATLDRIRARTGFDYTHAETLHVLPDPPDAVIDTLDALDPAGLRGELVGAS